MFEWGGSSLKWTKPKAGESKHFFHGLQDAWCATTTWFPFAIEILAEGDEWLRRPPCHRTLESIFQSLLLSRSSRADASEQFAAERQEGPDVAAVRPFGTLSAWHLIIVSCIKETLKGSRRPVVNKPKIKVPYSSCCQTRGSAVVEYAGCREHFVSRFLARISRSGQPTLHSFLVGELAKRVIF